VRCVSALAQRRLANLSHGVLGGPAVKAVVRRQRGGLTVRLSGPQAAEFADALHPERIRAYLGAVAKCRAANRCDQVSQPASARWSCVSTLGALRFRGV
jgi:hypothetical protein